MGFDVDMAHRLASELEVGLEFVPVEPATIDASLARGTCDLVMSGLAVTTSRASRSAYSDSYLDETFSFVVTDERRDQFSTWNAIEAQGPITIAVPDVPYYIDKLRARIPRARLQTFEHPRDLFENPTPNVDAIAMPAERGSAWTLLYPKFSVVVPEPGVLQSSGVSTAVDDQEFARFLNSWIDLKRREAHRRPINNGFGPQRRERKPRWSVCGTCTWVE